MGTTLTQPSAITRFLIVVVLVPRAAAMRASDKPLWAKSCLIASQSGGARLVSSEIWRPHRTFPSPLVGEGDLRKPSVRKSGEGVELAQFAFGVTGAVPQGTAVMVQLL